MSLRGLACRPPIHQTISFHFVCIRCPPGLSPCESLSFRLLWAASPSELPAAVHDSTLSSASRLAYVSPVSPSPPSAPVVRRCMVILILKASVSTIRGPPDWKDSTYEDGRQAFSCHGGGEERQRPRHHRDLHHHYMYPLSRCTRVFLVHDLQRRVRPQSAESALGTTGILLYVLHCLC